MRSENCPLLYSTRTHVLLHISPYTHFVIVLYIVLANPTLTLLDGEGSDGFPFLNHRGCSDSEYD
jgi:hypothetical protein